MMAGILIVYIRVIISWGITCVIFNLGGTRASVAFFDAFDVELGTLSPAQRKFVRVEKAGTHVSNFDWRRPNVWSTPEYQIQTVSQSAKDTGRFLKRFFLQVASPNCILRGIVEPRGSSFFDTLVEDNLRTGEDGTASASTELGRRGGEASSAIRRKSGDCIRPGCTYAIARGDLCIHHQPKKTKKSDKCRVCGRVFVAKETVRGGVCHSCYYKPETVAIRKKATAAKKVTRKTCSTPGCPRITDRGTDKCYTCTYRRKS
jgi:hypothetical protein